MDVREAIPMPPNLSWEQGAAIPLTFPDRYHAELASETPPIADAVATPGDPRTRRRE